MKWIEKWHEAWSDTAPDELLRDMMIGAVLFILLFYAVQLHERVQRLERQYEMEWTQRSQSDFEATVRLNNLEYEIGQLRAKP